MSIRVMTRVWDHSRHSGTELLMLLALADYSDDNGDSYPAVATLAAKCRLQPRRANYILASLQKSGELRVLQNEGPKGTNRYHLVMDRIGDSTPLHSSAPLQRSAPLHSSAPTPALECAKPLHSSADEPSLNHQEPSEAPRKRVDAAKSTPKPDDVTSQTWTDWLALRKTKRAPVTPTVVASAQREAIKAGMTLEDFLVTWCARGSQGLQADWLKPSERRFNGSTKAVAAGIDLDGVH